MHLSFEKLQQQFLDHLRFQKRYSRHTITSYENDLETFHAYLKNRYSDEDIRQVKTFWIRSWLAEINEKGDVHPKTISRKISTLRSFFKYLLSNEIVQVNPATAVITPKVPKRLPQFVQEKDIDTLFSEIVFPDDFTGLTESMIMKLFYHTGIRKAELIGLREHHADRNNSTLKVLGKGNKERVIPVSPPLMRELTEYTAEKKKLYGSNEGAYFFVTEKGKPLDPRKVYSIVKKYLQQVTTIEKKSPHILRHSFATHLMNNGADINAVKELLGHSSLAATQVYTHNSIEQLKDVYKKAHPKA